MTLGNSVLHKGSHACPITSELLEELFTEAGFTNGEFVNVKSSSHQTEMIISHKLIRGVSFTGSTRAGALISSIAGKYVKKVVMELGGSDPVLVLSDADVDRAATLSAESRLSNNGQKCTSGKRFIIHESMYD